MNASTFQFPPITPEGIINLVPVMATTHQPLMILGGPGNAKTQSIRQSRFALAAHHDVSINDVGFVEFPAADRDPFEINGLSVPSKTEDGTLTTKFTRSPVLQLILDTGCEYGVLFIDEITQASTDMLKSLRHAIDVDTRKLGVEKIPDGWIVMMAGNRLADKSGASRVLSHFANATMRREMDVPVTSWVKWAEKNGIHPMLVSCAQAEDENDLFVKAVPAEDAQFCTYRTYAHCDPFVKLNATPDGLVDVTPELRSQLSSWVGEAAADTMVNHFALYHKLPRKHEIMSDPETCTLPDDAPSQYAAMQLALSIAEDEQSTETALRYVMRARPDLQISTGAALLRKSHRQGFLLTGPLAVQFVTKYADVLPLTENA